MSVTDYLLGQLCEKKSGYSKKWEFDVNGNLKYFGWAKAGTLTSETGWTIKYFTWDASNLPATEIQTPDSTAIYDNRANYF